jgi:hypothetical protein
MFDDGRVGLAHVHELVELGLAFGALLEKTRGWKWVLAEQDGESRLGLQAGPASDDAEPQVVYPMAMLLDPVEARRSADVRGLFQTVIAKPVKR